MKNVFIVHAKRNKSVDQFMMEHQKIKNRITRKYGREGVNFLEIDETKYDPESIEYLNEYLKILAQADLVVFEPKYMFNEGTVVRLCCDLYSIPYINCPDNTYA